MNFNRYFSSQLHEPLFSDQPALIQRSSSLTNCPVWQRKVFQECKIIRACGRGYGNGVNSNLRCGSWCCGSLNGSGNLDNDGGGGMVWVVHCNPPHKVREGSGIKRYVGFPHNLRIRNMKPILRIVIARCDYFINQSPAVHKSPSSELLSSATLPKPRAASPLAARSRTAISISDGQFFMCTQVILGIFAPLAKAKLSIIEERTSFANYFHCGCQVE